MCLFSLTYASAQEATKKAVEEVKKEAAKAEKTATKAKATVAKKATAAKKTATAAKTTATKKATAVKKTATKTAKKTAAKAKKAIATASVIQYQGLEFTEDDCIKKAKAAFKKDYKGKTLEELNIYIKPEEHKIYYVANKDCVGSADL